MNTYSEPIARLINELSKLPTIGKKSAQRLAYHLVNADKEVAFSLSDAIRDARENVRICNICCNVTDKDPCAICENVNREKNVICVVQDSKDIIAVERTKEFKGVYHVLGGAISPMDGVGADKLNIVKLMQRLTPEVDEVILATNLSVEGETTAMYLARLIKPLGVKATRIARGIPAGAELEYTDETTLATAFEGRKEI